MKKAFYIKQTTAGRIFDICNGIIIAILMFAMIYPFWNMLVLSFNDGTDALLGKLMRIQPRLPLLPRVLLGAVVITAVELAAGLLVNREYRVWDYRNTPFNFYGQICLPFSLLWIPIAFGAMELYDVTENLIKT